MRYVNARVNKETREEACRIYVTDGIKIISENTAKLAGGSSFKIRYSELFGAVKEETRTEEEVVQDIREKLRKLGW